MAIRGFFSPTIFMRILFAFTLFAALPSATAAPTSPPYPPSAVIENITWHWDTLRSEAPGSDLWPLTWANDNNLYAAWGDGGGFGGTDQDGRVALGFARIEGSPEHFTGSNINGGKNASNPAAFPKQGKCGGLLASDGILYAWINRQNSPWPDVDEGLAWSKDAAKTWENSSWVFPKGDGNFKPSTFLNCGKDYAGVPSRLEGFIYFYGVRQGQDTNVYLGRVPTDRIHERAAYEFFCGLSNNTPSWSANLDSLHAIFTNSRGLCDLPTVIYHPALKRFLLTIFHKGPGQLGIFDAPQPWGPWTTVAYYEQWGDMGAEGHGLTCSFPQKWMSPDGLTLWCVFAVYGDGAKQGIHAHDQFNLVKATLTLHRTAK